jgi:hypothetical protein
MRKDLNAKEYLLGAPLRLSPLRPLRFMDPFPESYSEALFAQIDAPFRGLLLSHVLNTEQNSHYRKAE